MRACDSPRFCSAWLYRTDADPLAQDAVLGHYVSKDLRKDVAPYLKQ